jgi:hypothetical protein
MQAKGGEGGVGNVACAWWVPPGVQNGGWGGVRCGGMSGGRPEGDRDSLPCVCRGEDGWMEVVQPKQWDEGRMSPLHLC